MNLQLQHVIEDVTGVTGMRIIRAILAGERDPHQLAALRDPHCKNSVETIAKALEGDWRAEHLFALQQAVYLVEIYEAQIAECDRHILAHLQTFADHGDGETPSGPPARHDRHDLSFDATAELYRLTGLDLTTIDGLGPHTILKILSEIGLDMSKWPTSKHFGSWLGLAPNNRVSGGKIQSRRTLPNANRAATSFRLAAQSLHRSKCAIGAFLRRKAAKLGMPKAITATAYLLARILYNMLTHGTAFVQRSQDYYEREYQSRVLKNLTRRARELGYDLIKFPTPGAVPG